MAEVQTHEHFSTVSVAEGAKRRVVVRVAVGDVLCPKPRILCLRRARSDQPGILLITRIVPQEQEEADLAFDASLDKELVEIVGVEPREVAETTWERKKLHRNGDQSGSRPLKSIVVKPTTHNLFIEKSSIPQAFSTGLRPKQQKPLELAWVSSSPLAPESSILQPPSMVMVLSLLARPSSTLSLS